MLDARYLLLVPGCWFPVVHELDIRDLGKNVSNVEALVALGAESGAAEHPTSSNQQRATSNQKASHRLRRLL